MIPKHFDLINRTDIEALIENQVREGRTIEYKMELPGNSDEDKREFLADISSFANAGGGDLLYGIVESGGLPQEAIGLTGEIEKEILRLEQIIRTGLDPRIPSIQMKPIEGFKNGPILLIRIPKSWAAPHMVTFKNLSRFFTRNSAGKHQMDVTEIRAAFLLSESIREKIKHFRDERLGRIIANEIPVPLRESARLILHILPVYSFTSEQSFDISVLKERTNNSLRPIGYLEYTSYRYCLDGLVTYSRIDSEVNAYTLLFRNGQIEAVYADIVKEHHDRKVIPGKAYERYIITAVINYLKALKSLDISGPIVIFLCLTGVNNVYMSIDVSLFLESGEPIDRDTLVLPEVFIEDYESIINESEVARTLRPIFDAIWNACGFERSYNYDEDGNWNP